MSTTAVTTVPLVKTTDIPRYDGRLEDSALFLSVTGNTETTMVPFSTFKAMFPSLASEPAGPGSPGEDGFVAMGSAALYSYHGASWGASPRYTTNWQDLTADVRFLLVNTGEQALSDEEKGNAWKNLGLKPATTSEIGVVSIGEGLSVTEGGEVSVNRATPTIPGSMLLDSTDPEAAGESAASVAYVNDREAFLQHQIDEWAVPIATDTTVGGIIATDTVVVSETGEARVPNATMSQRGAVVLSDGTAADGVGVTTGADAANIAAAKVAELVVNATYGHPGILAPATSNSGIDLFEQDGEGTGLFSVSKAVPRDAIQILEGDISANTGSYGTVMPVASIAGDDETAYGNWVPTVQAVRDYVTSSVEAGISALGEEGLPREVLPIATYTERGVVRGSDTVSIDLTGRMFVPTAVEGDADSCGVVKTIGDASVAATIDDPTRKRVTVPTLNYMESFMDWAKSGLGSYGSVKVVDGIGGTLDPATGATVLPSTYASEVYCAFKTQSLVDGVRNDVYELSATIEELTRYPTTVIPYASNTQAGVVKLWVSGTVDASIDSDNIPLSMQNGYLYLDASYITDLIEGGGSGGSGGGGGGGGGGGTVTIDWASALPFDDTATTTASASAAGSISIGCGSAAGGVATLVVGTDSYSMHSDSVVVGCSSYASGPGANVLGVHSSADGGVAVGFNAHADNSLAIGNHSYAGMDAVAIGNSANVVETASVAIGAAARVATFSSVAIGAAALVSSTNSIAIGTTANALVDNAIQIGAGSNSNRLTLQVHEYPLLDLQTGLIFPERIASGGGGGGEGDCNVTITTRQSILCGYGATSNLGGGCVALGYDAVTFEASGNNYISTSKDSAYASVAYGTHTLAANRAVAIGGLAKAGNTSDTDSEGSVAIGFFATAGTDAGIAHALAIGFQASASAYETVAVGAYTIANDQFALAFGTQAEATNNGAMAVGYYSKAKDYASTAVGSNTETVGMRSTAVGTLAKTSGVAAASFGFFSNSKAYSTALGSNSKANGQYALAAGYSAGAGYDNSIALGPFASVGGDNGIAIGPSSRTTGSGIAVGGSCYAASGSISIGGRADGASSVAVAGRASGGQSIAIGENAKAEAYRAIQLGNGTNSTVSSLQVGPFPLLDLTTGYIYPARIQGGSSGAGGDLTELQNFIISHTTQKVDLGVLVGGAITVGFYYGSGSWDVYATGRDTVSRQDARDFPDIQIFFQTGGTAPIITWDNADSIHWLNTEGEAIPPEFDTYTSYHLGVSYEFGHYVVGITYQDTAN